MSKIRWPILIIAACFLSPVMPARAEKLRVGIAGAPPFAINNDSNLEGISIDIWQKIADSEDIEYEFVLQNNTEATLKAVVDGDLDLAIGSISITADRLEKVAFTQPFFLADIGVVLPRETPTLWNRIRPFFGVAFISSVAILLGCIFLVGNLLWLAEKHRNDQFSHQYWSGVGHGMWFALVTLTTVGYGDFAPITIAGRLIAGVWMVLTMVTVSSLTAGIATTLTLSLSHQGGEPLGDPSELKGLAIAVVSGTTGVKWATYYQARLTERNNLNDAILLLEAGRVDGVVFDSPALKYYLQKHPEVDLRLANFAVSTETYGIALPFESPLLRQLNVRLLKMQQEGTLREIEAKWLD
ncbi:MAG: transporter substrate-binding domain-containing protein [Hormoscilla sp. GM102CHS1]|nr:transporter substrate-binding domain-containing protein [Hormoscilla sp. GM102CHS1]